MRRGKDRGRHTEKGREGERKVGNRGRIQKSLRSFKMRSHIATVTPGSSVQSCEHKGERWCVCVRVRVCRKYIMLGAVLCTMQFIHTDK